MSRIIGAHVSAAGGIEEAPQRAHDIGCNVLMLYSASPRVWKKKPLDKQNFKQYHANCRQLGITHQVVHALYLANIGSEKSDLINKSVEAIKYELEFSAQLQAVGVVLHTGSHQGRGWDSVKDEIAQTLVEILSKTSDDSVLLLENAANHNGKIGNKLEEIRWLFDRVGESDKFIEQGRLGWCLDTCHAHAAGYWLGQTDRDEGQAAMFDKDDEKVQPQSLEKAIDRLDLWRSLKCIHVNDSKDKFGSGRDRHENINDGLIPQEDMEYFLNLKRIEDIPLILETPGINGGGPDAENVRRLKKLVGAKS